MGGAIPGVEQDGEKPQRTNLGRRSTLMNTDRFFICVDPRSSAANYVLLF